MVFFLFSFRHSSRHSLLELSYICWGSVHLFSHTSVTGGLIDDGLLASLETGVVGTVKVVVAPDALNQVLSHLFAPVERPGKVQVTIPDPP